MSGAVVVKLKIHACPRRVKISLYIMNIFQQSTIICITCILIEIGSI
jgi:hypothetical protein